MMGQQGDFPYYRFSDWLRTRWEGPVYRVAVDGGFTCPNRKAGRESHGCTYCDADGSRAAYQNPAAAPGTGTGTQHSGTDLLSGCGDEARLLEAIRQQALRGAAFVRRRYGARQLLLYFQAYSGTNAAPEVLKARYDAALETATFCGLFVATRPDCLDSSKVELLCEYQTADREVWVELGLQSAHDSTLARVNRGHSVADFVKAYELVKAAGLKIAVHLILGLPGEGFGHIEETARFVARLRPDAVKLHNLSVVKGSPLEREYLCGELGVPGMRTYGEMAIRVLELIPPETVVMRLTCDVQPDRLVAPLPPPDKAGFLRWLEQAMRDRSTRQGRIFTKKE